jgi:hypothetical protein
MTASRVLVGLVLALALSQAYAARQLRQVGVFGGSSDAIITSGYAGTSSVGAIDSGDTRGSQAAAYAVGMSRATGGTALGLAVSAEKDSGSATAAGDLIRRQAGYQGSSAAGDIFTGDTHGASPAEDAIRRTQADNAQVQARISARGTRTGSESPFDV